MATQAQITANRLNAQRSTGPVSAEGKAASRFNALHHGIDARSEVIPGEDPEALAALAAEYHGLYRPEGPVERCLVDAAVAADWTMRRYRRLEAQIFHLLVERGQTLAAPLEGLRPGTELAVAIEAAGFGGRAFQTVLRKQAAAEKSWYRALNELRELRAERAEAERQAQEEAAAEAQPEAFFKAQQAAAAQCPPQAARPPLPAALTPTLPTPADQIGFVPTNRAPGQARTAE